ncbi:glycosyltransferase family 2 protein [Inquilinus limosus]|uniref:glycosyltransferase family 2 protein n=1 Tax=Inquilinus limosus TaxID=171674 RepID=UPI003F187333
MIEDRSKDTAACPEVDVLVATYNGERFLPELLDSLLQQSHGRVNVIIGDDGSKDRTREVVELHRPRFGRLEYHDFAAEASHGACVNFSRLMAKAGSDYVMFCDQDDVWLPTKIERTLGLMRSVEAVRGPDLPILVHTDLKVVDRDLAPLAESMWRAQGIDPGQTSVRRLIVENNVTGCTAMINRALLRIVGDIPPQAIMHDWWIAVAAACFGTIAHLPEQTILYRQHGANAIGAKTWGVEAIWRQMIDVLSGRQAAASVQRTIDQAGAFLGRYGDRMDDATRGLFSQYAAVKSMPKLARKLFLIRNGLVKTKWQKSLGQILVT